MPRVSDEDVQFFCVHGSTDRGAGEFVMALALDLRDLRALAETQHAALGMHRHEDKCSSCCQDWPIGTPCSGCEFNAEADRLFAAGRAAGLGKGEKP